MDEPASARTSSRILSLAFATVRNICPQPQNVRRAPSVVFTNDPIALIRGRRNAGESGVLDQHVNDVVHRDATSVGFRRLPIRTLIGFTALNAATGW